ncbi:ATP-binding cassette domain-containing protein, partial [Escherichia coli]|uniref:ATP-binding cassette domain-containing protein n=1 Tax=Escherichia coli TaxID=562 RepID=UPI001C705C87
LLGDVQIGAHGRMPFWRTCVGDFTREQKQGSLQALARVGMVHFAHQRDSTLAGGKLQRVAIARALMQQAKVILAYEPIASLDPESARIVMDTLRDINQNDGLTVVFPLHKAVTARPYSNAMAPSPPGPTFSAAGATQLQTTLFS